MNDLWRGFKIGLGIMLAVVGVLASHAIAHQWIGDTCGLVGMK